MLGDLADDDDDVVVVTLQTIAAIMQPYPGTMGHLKRVPGSVGVLLPGMEARIVRDDGTGAFILFLHDQRDLTLTTYNNT